MSRSGLGSPSPVHRRPVPAPLLRLMAKMLGCACAKGMLTGGSKPRQEAGRGGNEADTWPRSIDVPPRGAQVRMPDGVATTLSRRLGSQSSNRTYPAQSVVQRDIRSM